jgi:hypothetical protein
MWLKYYLQLWYASECKHEGGWVASLKGGAMTVTETIALLMLIAYVVYLVVYISRDKD